MLSKILGSSWKTSLLGYVLGAAHLPVVMGPDGKMNLMVVLQALGIVLLGRFAKDGNVTGGSVAQPTVPNPPVL